MMHQLRQDRPLGERGAHALRVRISGVFAVYHTLAILSMMLAFLNRYSKALSLDDEKFSSLFASGVKKSDFLLFEESTVCEFKEVVNFDAPKRIEHVAKKRAASGSNFKRDFYNTINNALSSANQQITETKAVLGKPDALGLVVIENLVPKDLSVLALIDAADRKMGSGLVSVDAVLCLDFVNTFIDQSGTHIQPAQLVTRKTEKSNELFYLVGTLLEDFTNEHGRPLNSGFNIAKASQTWVTDSAGRYKSFNANLNIGDHELPSRDR